MMSKTMRLPTVGCLLLIFFSAIPVNAWQCNDAQVAFDHRPSDYYGSGEYVSQCPQEKVRIRCYHYHRHWICEKGDLYYWDRNLDSAARTACDCPLPEGVAPAAPAVSRKPQNRFHSIPAP